MNKLKCEISKKLGKLIWVLDLEPLDDKELVDTTERILKEFMLITDKKRKFDFNGVLSDCVEAKKFACVVGGSDEKLRKMEDTSRKRLSELSIEIIEK